MEIVWIVTYVYMYVFFNLSLLANL